MAVRLSSRTILTVTILLLQGCGGADRDEPPELVQAAQVVRNMIAPMNLSRSMFPAAYPDCKPSEFVNFFFSSMGAAERPLAPEWADEVERERLRSMGEPLMPADIHFTSRTPDPESDKQIVLRFDDDRGVVIVDAYLTPEQPPVFTRAWPLQKVAPAPGVRELYQSNVEMGMSPRSF